MQRSIIRNDFGKYAVKAHATKIINGLFMKELKVNQYKKLYILGVMIGIYIFLLMGCNDDSESETIDTVILDNGILAFMSDDVRRFDIDRPIAYMVTKDARLQLVYLSDLQKPKSIYRMQVNPQTDVCVDNQVLYILQENRLSLYDVRNPAKPIKKQDIDLEITEPTITGSIVFNEGRIFILILVGFDHGPPYSYFILADAVAPTRMIKYQMENADKIVGVDGDRVYTQRYGDLFVVDVSNPAHIQSSQIDLTSPDPLAVAVSGQTAYLVNRTGGTPHTLALSVMDLNSLSESFSKEIARIPFAGRADRGVSAYPKSIVIANHMAYVALITGELVLFDVSAPAAPMWIKTIDYGVVDAVEITEIRYRRMLVKGTTAYIGGADGLVMVDGPAGPDADALKGIFKDSPVKGIAYATPTRNGTTDLHGAFYYKPGEAVQYQ